MSERFAFTPPSLATSVAAAAGPAPAIEAAEPVAAGSHPERDRTAFIWTVIFTAMIFLRPQDIVPPLEYLHLAELSAILGLVSLVVGRLRRGAPIARWTPELVGVLVLGAIVLLTSPFSIWMGGSIGVFTDMYAKVILIYLLAVNVLESPDRLERLTWILVLAVGYIGFRAVLDYVRGVNLVGHGTRVEGSVGGIMQNPNDLALNMVSFLPLAVFSAIRPGSTVRRLVAAGCAVFMLGAIVASGSRGGFLGFAAMLIVLACFVAKQRPGLVIAGVLAMICALPVLPSSYWRRIESITDPSKDDFQSSEARKELFGESFDAFLQHPLTGVGAGEFKDWNPEHREQAWHEAHNVWLQLAAEIGIFGVAAFAFLVIRGCGAVVKTRGLLRRLRRRRNAPRSDLSDHDLAVLDAHSAAMAASMIGWLVCAFFASVAYNWTFYYLLALAAAPRDIVRASIRSRRSTDQRSQEAA